MSSHGPHDADIRVPGFVRLGRIGIGHRTMAFIYGLAMVAALVSLFIALRGREPPVDVVQRSAFGFLAVFTGLGRLAWSLAAMRWDAATMSSSRYPMLLPPVAGVVIGAVIWLILAGRDAHGASCAHGINCYLISTAILLSSALLLGWHTGAIADELDDSR